MKVLQFSGGIDSLATLFVKRPEWDNITVIWCNTGAAYPETMEFVSRIVRLVPHFHVVRSDKPAWEKINGIAVDLVPEQQTLLGNLIAGSPERQIYTSYLRCCSANIWEPLDKASRELGATTIIRGQRAEEGFKAPVTSGFVDQFGVTYEFPIESWTKAEVIDYCERICPEYIPKYYEMGEQTSRDCWDCIAYLHENRARIHHLHGNKSVIVQHRLRAYHKALMTNMRPLEDILENSHAY